MPDNHFEDETKKKLDELNFTPADSVWLSVQNRIKKDRDRRRFLLWLPLGCLLLGAAGWFLFSGKLNPEPAAPGIAAVRQAQANVQPGPQSVLQKKISDSDKAVRSAPSSSRPAYTPLDAAAGRAEPSAGRTGSRYGKQGAPGKQPASSGDGPEPGSAKGSALAGSAQTAAQRDAPATEPRDESSGDAATSKAEAPGARGGAEESTKAPGSSTARTDTRAQAAAGKTAGADSPKSTKPAKAKPAKKQGLRWGIVAGAGLAAQSVGFVDNYSVFASANGGTAPGYYALPRVKSAGSFYFGFRLSKALNKTTRLLSGLQYSYSAIRIDRGQLVNMPAAFYSGTFILTNVSSYYAASNTGSYKGRNQYHFLEIPLIIEKQLGPRSRFSVNAGLSAGWLFAADALQYDPQTGVYFKHNDYFNRIQGNVLGGFEYRLLQKKTYQLQIGPRFQYGLSSLLNKNSPYTEHRFSGGFQLLLMRNRN